MKAYTNAPSSCQDYAFDDGLFSGYDEAGRTVRQEHLDVRARAGRLREGGSDAPGSALRVPALKKHLRRYTPEVVSSVTGAKKEEFLQVCKTIATTAVPDRTMTSLYALGWTQHSVGHRTSARWR